MNSKSNKLLLGIVFFIIGFQLLFKDKIGFDYKTIILIISGCSMLLLYHTKRKMWSLFLGIFLTFLGIIKILPSEIFGKGFMCAMFFLIPGIIFMIVFHEKNKRGFLIPASTCIWIGIFFMLVGSHIITKSGALFFACIGLSLITDYVIGKEFIGKWAVLFGMIFVGLSIFSFFGASPFIIFNTVFPKLIAGILILISLFFIITSFHKSN